MKPLWPLLWLWTMMLNVKLSCESLYIWWKSVTHPYKQVSLQVLTFTLVDSIKKRTSTGWQGLLPLEWLKIDYELGALFGEQMFITLSKFSIISKVWTGKEMGHKRLHETAKKRVSNGLFFVVFNKIPLKIIRSQKINDVLWHFK